MTLANYVLERSRDFREAYSLTRRLRTKFLPETVALDLVDVIDQLETSLSDRRSVLQEAAAKPGSTAASIATALLDEITRIESSAPPGRSDPEASGGHIDEDSVLLSLTGTKSAAFRAMTNSLAGIDTSVVDGRRDALAVGFDGDCVLAVRVLMSTKEDGDPLSRRHATLGALNELRQHRLAYFDYCLRLNVESGTVPKRMLKYSLASSTSTALLDGILGLRIGQSDWIAAPHGAMGRAQHSDGKSLPVVHDPRDYYCQPQLITDVCEFLHILVVAIGGAPFSATGYTFLSLGDFFSSHLGKAKRQPTQLQEINWLIRASNSFQEALTAIGTRLRGIVYAARPSDVSLKVHVLEFDAVPIQPLKDAELLLDQIADRRAEEELLSGAPQGSSSGASSSYQLPLLSKALAKSTKPTAPGDGGKSQLKGKKRALEETQPGLPSPFSGGLPHGCLSNSWRYLSGGKHLIISGKDWDLVKLAAHLGVNVQGPCWPFHLSLCEDKNRLARCNKVNDPKHAGMTTSSHVLQALDGADLSELAEKFAKKATVEQKQGLNNTPQFDDGSSSAARGKGRGRGSGSGRGRGRGRGRGGDGDKDGDEDGDAEETRLVHFQQPPVA